jgi:hypothetical protein
VQGPSPDEVALVEGAARLGFVLTARTSSYLTISLHGEVGTAMPPSHAIRV